MSDAKRDPFWIGIAPHGAGWRATVSQGRDKPPIRRHFPQSTDPRTMQIWRADTKAHLRLTRKSRATMGAFRYDARKRYLPLVASMPTYEQRERHIEFWIDQFGDRQRDDITARDVQTVREALLVAPRSTKDARPLSAGTINKLLRALSNVYTVLDGPRAENPVRDVEEVPEPSPRPQGLPYATIDKLLASLPPSKSAIRLRCLAYCPLTPKQLAELTPGDIDLRQKRLRLPARLKGQGADALWTPLLPQAADALADFHRQNCYGDFARGTLRLVLRRAAKRIGLKTHLTVYMLRHSFATMAYEATGSLETVGRLLQHAHPSTTRRYALGAEQAVLDATVERISDHLARGTTYRDNTPAKHGKSRPKMAQAKRTLKRTSTAGKHEKTAKLGR